MKYAADLLTVAPALQKDEGVYLVGVILSDEGKETKKYTMLVQV